MAFALAAFACCMQPTALEAQAAVSGPAPPAIIAIEPKLDARERSATFTLTLSARTELTFEHLTGPLRIVADLPEANIQALARQARGSGLVASFRAGLVAPGRSRMVFELNRPARVSEVRWQTRPAGVVDLVIVFEAVPAADFDSLAAADSERRAQAALAPVVVQPRSGTDRRLTVVIDPGHGGIDPGAVADGAITEKAIVLSIALRLRDVLDANGRVRVIMTRSDDRFLSLAERVRIARENQADLFVSLHADSLSAAQDVRGATIYTGSERATDAESARLAQKENAADAVGGADTASTAGEVQDILNDLARRETRALSHTAAATLVTQMSGAVKMHRIPQRSAGFRVLTAPDVPSVLIELGYLSSRGDIALLTSDAWQRTAAEAISEAILKHLSGRRPHGG